MEVREAVLGSIREHGMLKGADRIICALSGGADSVCLADVLLSLSAELGFRLECAHFNHRLRGEESLRDASFVAAWCSERGLKLYTGSSDVSAYASVHRMGTEEAARTLRYEFLERLGDERTRIATAHQADDQAETLLMNLLRGSGLKGLGGIPPVRGRIIRPLLGVRREDILAYLAKRGLSFVEDSSNRDTDYRRNKLRHTVMPLLRELNLAFAEACGRTAGMLREDEAFLSDTAAKYVTMEGERAVFSVRELMSLPGPLSSRALRQAAARFGIRPEEKHINALLSLAASENPSARMDLHGGVSAQRQYDRLLIGKRDEPEPFRETALSYGSWTEIDELDICVFWGERSECGKIHGKFTTYFFKKDRICGRITVRPRKEGDYLRPTGRQGKTLKKWMIQEKIPAAERNRLPVFADEKGVLAVRGIGADVRAQASREEADSVLVILERK